MTTEPLDSPSLLSVLQLLLALHLLFGPSLLEAPGALESLGGPDGPAAPEDLEHPAEHKYYNYNLPVPLKSCLKLIRLNL